VDGDVLVVEVLDTAGQEEFKTMREQWIRQGEGFFIVYSITSRNSFSEVIGIRKDIERTREDQIQTSPCLLFANKVDLSDTREVSTEEGLDTAKSFSCPFFEGSAKTNINLEQAYFSLIRSIKKYREEKGGVRVSNNNLPYQKRQRRCIIL